MRRKIATILAAVFFATFSLSALCACGGGDTTSGGGNEPHTHAYGEWHTTKDATCTEDGERQRECTTCDDVEKQTINKLGHAFGAYTSDGNATCTEDGTMTAQCTRAGCTETDTRPVNGSKLGHSYDTKHYVADETEHFYACSRCGAQKEGTAEPHTMVNDYECSTCGWHADGTTSLGFIKNEDVEGGGYTVTGVSNRTLTKLVIPDTHNGKPVTAIAANAFRGDENEIGKVLQEVVFGKNVKNIGQRAFVLCPNLKTVTIGGSEVEIAYGAFMKCPSLTEINFGGDKVKIGDWAFQESGLKTLSFGDCDIDITQGGFYGCTSLTDVVFGDGDISIGDYTFQGCSALKTITIGNGNVVLGTNVDWDCQSLTDIVIGDGNVKFRKSALYASPKLTNLTVGNGDLVFEAYAVNGCPNLEKVTLGNGEISFGNYVFYGCTQLKDLTFGNNVTDLGDEPFGGCPALQYNKKDGVKYLGNKAHPYTVLVGAENTNISSVAMGADTKFVQEYAFNGCSNLASVTFGEHLKKIRYRAFEDCVLLQSVVFRDDLQEIEHNVFEDCTALETVTFGDGIQTIGEYAFDGCTAIQTVNIPSLAGWLAIEFAGEQFIAGSNPLSAPKATLVAGGYPVEGAVVIPEGVPALKPLAFAGYAKLTSLEIGKDVTEIGAGALLGCKNVKELTVAAGNQTFAARSNCVYDKTAMSVALGCPATVIPEDIKLIPANVFREVSLSATFVIPDSVEEIGERAFMSCGTFKNLTLGAGLKTVGDSAFFGATVAYDVSVTYHIRDLAKWCAVEFANDDANPLRWESAEIYAAPHVDGEETEVSNGGRPLIIPEGVTEIKAYAFWHISTQELHLPSTVAKIAPTAFGRNDNLSGYKVAAGNEIYEVQDCGVVEKATNTLVLGTVPHEGTIGEGIEKIGDYAFSGKIFRNVSIASSVKEIGAHAFESCRIESLEIGENVEKIGGWAFASNKTGGAGIGAVVIPANVTEIGESAFYQSGVTSLTLGEKVEKIGENAFALNDGLTSVTIPARVTQLGKGAFWGCGLTEATFDDTGWTVKDSNGYNVTPNFSDKSAVANALKNSSYIWTKNA